MIFEEKHISLPKWMDSEDIYKEAGIVDTIGKGMGFFGGLANKMINVGMEIVLPTINKITGYDISQTELYSKLKEEIRMVLVEDGNVRAALMAAYVDYGWVGFKNSLWKEIYKRLIGLKEYAKTDWEKQALEAILNKLRNSFVDASSEDIGGYEETSRTRESKDEEYSSTRQQESAGHEFEMIKERSPLKFKICLYCGFKNAAQYDVCKYCGKEIPKYPVRVD